MKLLRTYLSLVLALVLFLSFAQPAAAGSMYLSPGSKTAASGSTFSLGIRANMGGDLVNAVEANLSYPSDKLDFVGISAGGSAFPIDASSGGGGGGVRVSRGVIGQGVSGDKLIATVSFRVKAGASGTATIGLSGSLVRGADQANISSDGAGATITIGGTQTSSNTTTAKQNQQKLSPTPTPLPLTISAVKVQDIQYKQAVVTFTTSRPAIGLVEYGLSKNYGLTAQETTATTTHSLALTSELLTPGVTYHVRALSSEKKDDNPVISSDISFTTKGLQVEFSLTTAENKPVANHTVQLVTPQQTKTAKTNNQGVVTFTDLPPTQHTLIVDVNGAKTVSTITLTEPDEKTLQSGNVPITKIPVKVAGTTSTMPSIISIGLSILTLVLLAGIVVFLKLKRKIQQPTVAITNIPPQKVI